MKKYIALFFYILILAACSQDDVSEPVMPYGDDLVEVIPASLGTEVDLPYGDYAFVEEGEFMIHFDSLIEDSRCPPSEDCIWEGRAWVNLIANKGGVKTDIKLITENSINLDSFVVASYGNYSIGLVDITPPFNGSNILNPEDYTVIFTVTEE